MSAAQAYYDQVLSMGHSHENALAHTRQHYPNFVPGIAEAVAAPVMTPVSQQAIPAAQNVALPGTIGAPAVAAPMAPVAAPAGNGSQRVRSSSLHPAAGRGYNTNDVGCCSVHCTLSDVVNFRSIQSSLVGKGRWNVSRVDHTQV
jgi:hypothetical protein